MAGVIFTTQRQQCLLLSSNILTFSTHVARNTRLPIRLLHNKISVTGRTMPLKPVGSSEVSSQSPLSLLPLSTLVRSYLVTFLCSSPRLLDPALAILSRLVNSRMAVADPDRNPILKYILKKTFYAHFCAGETSEEAKKTILSLKNMGYGVILVCAKERDARAKEKVTEDTSNETEVWKKGNLETVRLAGRGDFVALKYKIVHLLLYQLPPITVPLGLPALESVHWSYWPGSCLLIEP